ncbi:hypothetical protein HDV06_004020 [Boothiomyces sp. JEL0866]|nr:hypothetical protein HDV06_004020 [Boothiomyces sp. JEL0866]
MNKLIPFTELKHRIKKQLTKTESSSMLLNQYISERNVTKAFKQYKDLKKKNLLTYKEHSNILTFLTEHIQPHLANNYSLFIQDQISPEKIDHHNFMTIYLRDGDHARLVEYFESVRLFMKPSIRCFNILMASYLYQDKYDQVIQTWKECCTIWKGSKYINIDGWCFIIEAYGKAKLYNQVQEICDVLKENGTHDNNLELLNSAFIRAFELEKSLEIYLASPKTVQIYDSIIEKVLETDQDPSVYYDELMGYCASLDALSDQKRTDKGYFRTNEKKELRKYNYPLPITVERLMRHYNAKEDYEKNVELFNYYYQAIMCTREIMELGSWAFIKTGREDDGQYIAYLMVQEYYLVSKDLDKTMEAINYDSESDWSEEQEHPVDPFPSSTPYTNRFDTCKIEKLELFQYWKSSLEQNSNYTSIMLQQSQSADYYYKPPNNHFVTEIDLIREVLFILQGLDSITFQMTDEYKYVKKFSLLSISDSGLTSIMNDFAAVSTCLLKTKIRIQELLLVRQTVVQAFAVSINKEYQVLMKQFSELELRYRNGGELKTSLIDLLFVVKKQTKRIYDISDFLASNATVPIDGIQILNALYENEEFHSIFLFTAKPIFDTIASCISSGVLDDPFDEFFLERCQVENEMDFNDCTKIFPSKLPGFLQEFSASILECYKSFLLFGITYPVNFKNIYGSSSSIIQKNTELCKWLLSEPISYVECRIDIDSNNFRESLMKKIRDILDPAFKSVKQQVKVFLFKTHNINKVIQDIQQIYFLFSVDMKLLVEKMLSSKPQPWQIRNILYDGLQGSINQELLDVQFRNESGIIFDGFDLLFNVNSVNLVPMASKSNRNH